mgnify:CR=1 FL=1
MVSVLKCLVVVQGVCLSLVLVVVFETTPLGNSTYYMTQTLEVAFLGAGLYWFVCEALLGFVVDSLHALLVCAACDQEMFRAEQRFMSKEVAEFLEKTTKNTQEEQPIVVQRRWAYRSRVSMRTSNLEEIKEDITDLSINNKEF